MSNNFNLDEVVEHPGSSALASEEAESGNRRRAPQFRRKRTQTVTGGSGRKPRSNSEKSFGDQQDPLCRLEASDVLLRIGQAVAALPCR